MDSVLQWSAGRRHVASVRLGSRRRLRRTGTGLLRIVALTLLLAGCDQLFVELDVTATSKDGQLLIDGRTNLPDGMLLVATVLPLAADPEITEPLLAFPLTVHSGRIQTTFPVNETLSAGTYTFRVYNQASLAQPPDVRAVIGDKRRTSRAPWSTIDGTMLRCREAFY